MASLIAGAALGALIAILALHGDQLVDRYRRWQADRHRMLECGKCGRPVRATRAKVIRREYADAKTGGGTAVTAEFHRRCAP